MSLDFIMGLPKSESGRDGILTVVDRATKMVHLIPVYQTITTAETAQVYWSYVGSYMGSQSRSSVTGTPDLSQDLGRNSGGYWVIS